MKKIISQPLGLYGWNELDPVILAALISEEPLLLIGSHGCAKSFILQRLAEALKMEFRSYNASIINYDDLVGIPMPDETKTDLHFISLPDSIWNAEIVFIDEINRTRPDLQNKLFPIIYDKRIQGRELGRLRYRWAAMNPPDNDENEEMQYTGAMPLDAALADRFTFVVTAPDWSKLSDKDRENLLLDQFVGRHEFQFDVKQLIVEARDNYERLVRTTALQVVQYINILSDQLRAANFDVSTRRATMLMRSLLAIHAARLTLNDGTEDVTLYGSAQMAILCTLPDRARRIVSDSQLMGLCKYAWQLAAMEDDNAKKLLMKETDLVERLRIVLKNADAFETQTIATVVTDGIAAARYGADRRMLSLISYLRLRRISQVPATTIETLANELKSVFSEKYNIFSMRSMALRTLALEVENSLTRLKQTEHDHEIITYAENLLYSLVMDAICDFNPDDITTSFVQLWKEVLK